ncbi:MAG: hypothetical protein RR992_01950, partial [Clostridiales bacterium]
KKNPSIAETLDWAQCLLEFNADRFTEKLIADTINVLLKDEEDYAEFQKNGGTRQMLRAIVAGKDMGKDDGNSTTCSCGHHHHEG